MKESDKENIQNDDDNVEPVKMRNMDNFKEEAGDANIEPAHVQLKLSDMEMSYLIAACETNFKAVNSILANNPSFVNMKNPLCDGYTALHFACKFGATDVIRALIGNYKADVNIVSNSGKTPLHVAVQFKQEEVARLLLSQYNANKELRDYSGRLAADIIVADDDDTIMKLVGPATSKTLVKPTKASPTMITSLKKNLSSLSSMVSSDSPAKSFFSLRKGSDVPSIGHHHNQHQLVPSVHHKDPGRLSPYLFATANESGVKKSFSFLPNRSSVKHGPSFRSSQIAKEDEPPL